MRERLQHYINGQWVDSEGGKRHEVINPATEEACCAITLGTQADVDKAVAAAQAAFRTFSKTTREERLALMERIVAEYKSVCPNWPQQWLKKWGACQLCQHRPGWRGHWRVPWHHGRAQELQFPGRQRRV
jgi:aldehyde dehydrogenase (NAD+)